MTEVRWQTVYTRIRKMITDGELEPGDQVPAELELASRYGYSRATIRTAMTKLVAEGLISSGGGSLGRRVLPRALSASTTLLDLQERIGRIAAWHSRETGEGGTVGDFCVECERQWPCDTRKMADGTYVDEDWGQAEG